MKDWIKVWWHCLLRTMSKKSHRMCWVKNWPITSGSGWIDRADFCECGYMKPKEVEL